MPKILPIRDLKNTASISKYVEESNEPVFITKNGYGCMVMMSMEVYEREIAHKPSIIKSKKQKKSYICEKPTKYNK